MDVISEVKTEIGGIKLEVQSSNLATKTHLPELNEAINAQTTEPPPEPKSVPRTVPNRTIKRDQFDGIRLRGIPELKSDKSGPVRS